MFPPASWIQKLGWRTATCSYWSCRDFRSPGIFKMYPSTASTYLSKKKNTGVFWTGVNGHRSPWCFFSMFWKDQEVSAGLLHNIFVCIPLHAVLVPFFTQHGEFIPLPCKCANKNLSSPAWARTHSPCLWWFEMLHGSVLTLCWKRWKFIGPWVNWIPAP